MSYFFQSGSWSILTHWMINLRQLFYFMLYLDIEWFTKELFTSLPYYLDMNSHSITMLSLFPLGLCKSLMSIWLFRVFCMKGEIQSIELPKALSFCVFSCGKDKRLKTLWHRPWAFAGYCNPFMVSWIFFKKSFFFFLDELTEHFLKQSWHITMYTCYRILKCGITSTVYKILVFHDRSLY